MGICSSCEAVSVIAATSHRRKTSTAKVIHNDGRLQEFLCPVKVSYVLQRVENPTTSFICNSDEMNFDDVVSAIGDDEELHPGQLYFVLPISRLSRQLPPEEMAALAVKASAALMKNGGGIGGDLCGCKTQNKCGGGGGEEVSGVVVGGGGRKAAAGNVSRRRSNGSGGGGGVGKRRKVFTANLSTIQE